jgi:hypothetical protein
LVNKYQLDIMMSIRFYGDKWNIKVNEQQPGMP